MNANARTAVVCLAMLVIANTNHAAAQGTSAQMLAGGEWALGRWEGTLVGIGTSSGTIGLGQSLRTLIVQKADTGAVTCLWFISNNAKSTQWTNRCKVGPKDITLETSAAASVELWRTGPDTLQGRFVSGGPPRSSGMWGAQQLHLNRVR